jgi:hypothetical protein
MRSNRLTVLSISFAQKEDVSFLCTPKCHNGGGDSYTINCKEPLEAGVSAQWAGEERCHVVPSLFYLLRRRPSPRWVAGCDGEMRSRLRDSSIVRYQTQCNNSSV